MDRNHLRRTARRVKQPRGVNAAPLRDLALVVLDPQSGFVIDAFSCQGVHAQQRSPAPQPVETL